MAHILPWSVTLIDKNGKVYTVTILAETQEEAIKIAEEYEGAKAL